MLFKAKLFLQSYRKTYLKIIKYSEYFVRKNTLKKWTVFSRIHAEICIEGMSRGWATCRVVHILCVDNLERQRRHTYLVIIVSVARVLITKRVECGDKNLHYYSSLYYTVKNTFRLEGLVFCVTSKFVTNFNGYVLAWQQQETLGVKTK